MGRDPTRAQGIAYAWFIWRPGHERDPSLGFLPPPPKAEHQRRDQ